MLKLTRAKFLLPMISRNEVSITLSTLWLESISPTDRHGRVALDFCYLSGCEQLVRCSTHIAGN